MTTPDQTGMLEAIAAILLRCFLLCMAVLLLWFGFILLGADFAYGIHSQWFELSRHDFDLMNYYGMALIKGCGFMFFLFPYISIRLVLRKKE